MTSAPPAAISLAGVGKRYVQYEDTPLFVSRLHRLYTRTRREKLWALRGLDLEVAPGDCVGIVGRNGSGKSTLLQLLCGITAPTEGRVVVRGRVAPLISVGVGFHPELTGRDNVYVNGAILGLTRAEIDARFDEIVDFSGIEEFIDTPVKFYSSGMAVRLGFAVAVQADPDVLLVDEVLAVGDLAFQMKCFDRMRAIRSGGTTVLVVSHNLNAIRQMCARTLLLHRGRLVHDGTTQQAITLFHELLDEEREPDRPRRVLEEDDVPHLPGRLDIEAVQLLDASGDPARNVPVGSMVRLRVSVAARDQLARPYLGFSLTSERGTAVYVVSHGNAPFPDLSPGQRATWQVCVPLELAGGSYEISASVAATVPPGGLAIVGQLPPIRVYVAGRHMVHGVADLRAEFSAITPDGSAG